MRKLTLAQQYMIVSFLVMFAGMFVIGSWVAQLIEQGVTNRTAAVTALYVDSYISPYLQELTEQDSLREGNIIFFENLLAENRLGRQMLSFKIWSPNGTIVYSQDASAIGAKYPIEAGLAVALGGEVHSELSQLDREEHELEREISSELIETYAPVRADDSDEVIAVSEFYQSADELLESIQAAQIRSWLVVGLVMLTVYLLLAGLVGRASRVIQKQQQALRENVSQLNGLLTQNRALHERSRRAAAQTTALNERYLRRISSDLHDGPAQDLALALLQMDSLRSLPSEGALEKDKSQGGFQIVRGSVETALQELRTISAGLRLPHIQHAGVEETVRRAVRDYEQRSDILVNVEIGAVPGDAPLATKIALFRVISEALNNGYRHAQGKGQVVRSFVEGDELYVEIQDHGPGFDPAAVRTDDHLGLLSMSERVEMLGGEFSLDSEPGQGTIVRAALPLTEMGDNYE